ncbi:MAG: polysaccharide deacetylase family protein [Lachnospiraceae bacterium]|nr:polysaccharide deacetylase family protein [Lachnospiraceae bacterium]
MARRKEKKGKKKSGRSWKLTLLLFLLLLLASAAVLFTMDGRHVQFRLVGSSEITVPYGEDFVDPGRSAVTVGRLFGTGVLVLPVETSGYVNTKVIGTYELTYTTEFLFDSYSAKRIVHVADLTPPTITLQTVNGYQPDWFTGYEEEGFLAWDNCDGDLTAQVEREVLEDRIEYRVSDSSGNEAVAERTLPAVAPPELTLLGEEYMVISASMEFEDPGVIAVDGKGNDLSDKVTVEGSVTPYKLGEYELTYSLSNGAETVSVTRTVVIERVELPAVVQPDEKTIYLTFDDGPGPYTGDLLDILANYDVKATFFVTGLNPEYEDMIGRAYREGHTIAVHTLSHNYYAIYASEQNYLDDFYAAQEIVYRQTGSYTRMFRFPGGSSNTVSNFNPGIISRLTVLMNNMGYQYFDWHIDSGDAVGTRTTAGVVANVTSGCTGRKISVVLQHDVKDYSVAAVEQIIIWGRQNGYTFRALELDSPTAHHRIAN